MAEQIRLDFDGVTAEQYWAVNEELGVTITDPSTWPPGMIAHSAALIDGGAFSVTEVWESRAAQNAFMESSLGAALAKVQVPAPTRVAWGELLADERR